MGRFANIILGILIGLAFLAMAGRIMFRRVTRAEEPLRLILKWIISGILLWFVGFNVFQLTIVANQMLVIVEVLLAAAGGIILGIIWAPQWGALLAKPLADLYDGGGQEIEVRPLYSRAEALRKKGCYVEAVAEIQQELAKFPNDFQGTMLLAEIQAECLNDFPAARDTLEQMLSQPGQTPDHLAYTLHRLSDWHLKLSRDVEGARAALERIVRSFPATELAQVAHQRLAHLRLPERTLSWEEQPRVALPHSDERLGLREDFSGLRPPPEDIEVAVAHLTGQLEHYPQDWEAREQLALIYANEYQRLDLAADQLEQLIAQPGQPAKQVVHWLNTLADLQVKHRADSTAARASLDRIVRLFPHSAAAAAAQNRSARINLEFKAKQISPAVKLGSYEQRLGLKAGGPPKPQR